MVHNFTDEFELIIDDRMREFAVDAVGRMDEETTGQDISYIKAVIEYAREFCDVIDAEDEVRDIITVASLIHFVAYDESAIFPLQTRIMLNDLMPKVGRDTFNNVLFLVERQQGFFCPLPDLQPQMDSPIHVWLLPMAIHLAKKRVFVVES